MDIDPTDETLSEYDDEPEGMLVGYELGSPAAFSGDCDLQPYDRKRPGSGCCAVITCECRQTFRIDLLAEEFPRCPKCKQQYTSLLVVCQVGDDTMLQSVFEHLVANNEELAARVHNAGEDEEEPGAVPDAAAPGAEPDE